MMATALSAHPDAMQAVARASANAHEGCNTVAATTLELVGLPVSGESVWP